MSQSQQVVKRRRALSYAPYGYRPCDGSTDLGFNGIWRDPVNSHYSLGQGYRFYDTQLMRFTQPDAHSPFAAGGLSYYAYCENDPINHSDPTGAFTWPLRRSSAVTPSLPPSHKPSSTITINRRGYTSNLYARDVWNSVRAARINWRERQIEVPLASLFANQHDPRSRMVLDRRGITVELTYLDAVRVLISAPVTNAGVSVRVGHVLSPRHTALSRSGVSVTVPYSEIDQVEIVMVRRIRQPDRANADQRSRSIT